VSVHDLERVVVSVVYHFVCNKIAYFLFSCPTGVCKYVYYTLSGVIV